MKKIFASLLFVFLVFTFTAQSSTISVTFTGVKSLMPQVLESSAYCVYNNKIYIFGGFTYDSEQNKVLIYDPIADTWSTGANLSTARFYATASELNGKIYVIGGAKIQSGSSVSLNSVEVYDPSSNTFSSASNLPATLRGASSVSANGKIYVIGGKTSSSFSNAVYEYNPSSNSWTNFSTAPFSAAYGGAVYSSTSNKIYYFGGLTGEPNSSSNYLGKAYSLDLTSSTWEELSNMPFKTSNFATAFNSSNGKAYLIGGSWYDITTNDEVPYYDIMVFDTSSEMFSSGILPFMPAPLSRYNNCAGIVNGKLYLIGGTGVLTVDEYDFSSDSFYEPNEKIPEDITGAASAVYNNKFYVADGGFWNPLNGKVWEYSPDSNSWAQKSGTDPQARIYPAYCFYNNKLFISGGMNTSGAVLSGVVSYDLQTNSFSTIAANDPNPSIFSASTVYNGKLYIFGGRTTPTNENSLSNKTRIFDIGSSSFSQGPDLPFELEQASAVTIGEKIYIFGGATLTPPDYINKNVIVFDPASQTFTTGPQIPYPTYGSSATSVGNYALFDSGYYLFYSSNLQGFGGGPFPFIQVFDSSSSTFITFPRPNVKLRHSTGVIGTKFYATAGDDGDWPSSRLDIANITITGCSFTCTASASPESGSAPLQVNFSATVSGSGCSGSPSYSWNFGDGNTSSEQNPVHTYSQDGTYNWTLTVLWGGQTCQKSGTITVGGCQITCEATVSPTSGSAPLTVSFAASSTATGCSSNVTYEWDFGDGTKSSDQTTSHTYSQAGTYNYTLTAKSGETTCTKNGTITVSSGATCTLSCEAVANPSSGSVPLTVSFTGTETHQNCSGNPSFSWNFGDGSTSTEQNPAHTYTTAGTYNWTFTVSLDGQTCTKSGQITAIEQSKNPVITAVTKVGSPFRLKVIGSNFVEGSEVLINGIAVPSTKYKSSYYLVAKKGAALKAMVPLGVTVTITVKNPDGSTSNEFNYTRQ